MLVKYAYIIFSLPFPFPRLKLPFTFDASTELKEGSVKEQVECPDSKHWAEWLGTLTWEAVCENQLLLSTWAQSDKPEILDQENQALQAKVSTIFRILPLVAPLRPPFSDVFMFSGKGVVTQKGLLAQDIRSFSRVNTWTRSYYNEHHWDEFHDWAQAKVMSPALLDEWKTCYSHYQKLFVLGKANRQLFEGYRSFEEAMKGTQLEFKIPNLVRALECVIDCWGFKDFATRVLFLTGVPDRSLPYSIATDTEALLQDLYKLRNDCSHGKPFAYSLEKKLGKPPEGELVAKYEFLAEWVARKVLNGSFMNASILQHTHNRDSLVDAWSKGLIKP